MSRIWLSPPHLSGNERRYCDEAFDSNWIAPVGSQLDAFEREFAAKVGVKHAVAVASGTAALHLAMRIAGIGAGDEVICSSLTFIASATPALMQGAKPVFIDSDVKSWNMDPVLLAGFLEQRAKAGKIPKAIVPVHLYGQSADMDPILAVCKKHGVTILEDAAEALGATYKGRSPGVFGKAGVFSLTGNKIITTSVGGMLVTDDAAFAERARYLATQARDPVAHYQHSDWGYNYRMSNVLAGIGRGQLEQLDDKVNRRRAHCDAYKAAFADLPGVTFMPEADFGRCTRWLTCLTVDPKVAGTDRETIRLALDASNIESRPVWKPMHLQPVFADCEMIGGAVSEKLFADGLCLPSGSGMTDAERDRVIAAFRKCFGR
jgi:dTDP-4-amino-4,6-dideoxygalactose transaminase